MLCACYGEKLPTLLLLKLHTCAHSLNKHLLSTYEWRIWMDWQSVVSDWVWPAAECARLPGLQPLSIRLPEGASWECGPPVEAPAGLVPVRLAGRCGLRQVADIPTPPTVPSPSRWCQVHTGHVGQCAARSPNAHVPESGASLWPHRQTGSLGKLVMLQETHRKGSENTKHRRQQAARVTPHLCMSGRHACPVSVPSAPPLHHLSTVTVSSSHPLVLGLCGRGSTLMDGHRLGPGCLSSLTAPRGAR